MTTITRYTWLIGLATFLRIGREPSGTAIDDGPGPTYPVPGLPENLRRDVGLPPTIERPPPPIRPWLI